MVWEDKKRYDFIEDSIKALDVEIQRLKEDGGKDILLFDGKYLGMSGNKYIYFFNLEEEIYLMDDAPVKVKCNKITTEGVAIFCQGFEILLALNDRLSSPLKNAILQSELWELLVALQKRLRELPDKGNFPLVRSVADLARSFAESGELICQGQKRAITKALKDKITFIWGPPGTGKTYTLAQIALKSFLAGEKVLILSHANIAVDGAIEAIAKQISEPMMATLLDKNQVFPVVRYGYSRSDFLRHDQYYSSYNQALNSEPDLKDRIKELEEKIKETEDRLQRVALFQRLGKLKNKVTDIEKETVIPKSKVVGTTISKAQVDPVIFKGSFDVVLLDEASMAYIPQSLFAAGLAGKRIVYLGDFKQLAPIAMTDGFLVDKWLKRDIFEFTKVKERVDQGLFPPHLAMLNKQRRMHPSISGFVTVNIYNHLLQNHNSVEDNRPWNEVFHLLDTCQMLSITMRDRNDSRFNVLHAFLSVIIALNYNEEKEGSVGIITPYSAQSKFINNILKDIFGAKKWPVNAATVHRFQGSERETIIFDTVDSFRLKRPGILLTSNEREQAQRLINVAVTRAKKQFVAVSNMSYWKSRLSKESILYKLLAYLQEKGAEYNFMGNYKKSYKQIHLLTDNKLGIRHHPNFDGSGMDRLLSRVVKDLTEGQSIYISCPNGGEATAKSLEKVFTQLPNLQKKKITIKAEKPEQLPPSLQRYAEKDSFAWLPLLIVDKKIIHYGFPICVDEQVKDVMLIRFEGEATGNFLASQLGFDDDIGSLLGDDVRVDFRGFVENNFLCPRCKDPMTVKKSKKIGKYFLGCSGYPKCSYIANDMLSILDEYLRFFPACCDRCGGAMAAKLGRNGVFIGCSNFPSCRKTANVGSVC
jgi:hypothetical protein